MSGTESQRYESAHDPLCPNRDDLFNPICKLCSVLAAVRADERNIIRDKISMIPAHKRVEHEGRWIGLISRSDCIKAVGDNDA